MQPGSETTVVVNLDYHSTAENSQPVRIVASLNDWTIDRDGQVQFERANTLPNSASSWLIYSPAETTVIPGNLHAIRVTVSVPKDATPGDHLTALIIEQRPDNIKLNENRRQMVIRYRMAAVFYIKVPQLRRQGSLESLRAEATDGPGNRNSPAQERRQQRDSSAYFVEGDGQLGRLLSQSCRKKNRYRCLAALS